MSGTKVRQEIFDYGVITVGTILMALGLNLFLIPNRIAAGGVSGIATVLFHLFQWPVGLTSLIMNIPLFIIGLILLGRSFGAKTFYATILLSFAIDTTAFLPAFSEDLLLASLGGGVLIGTGLGLIFHNNGTTGGTDIAAKIVHHLFPFLSIGQFLFLFDAVVVFLAGMVFRNYDIMLYAAITIFVTTKVIDTVLVGVNYTNTVYIISDHYENISDFILKDLNRGATELVGYGKYSGEKRPVLMAVLKSRDIVLVKQKAHEIDPQAFIFITPTREVLGEGFTYGQR